MDSSPGWVAVVDGGKSGTRIWARRADGRVAASAAAGVVFAADQVPAHLAVLEELVRGAGLAGEPIEAMVLGLTSLPAGTADRTALAEGLRARLNTRVVVLTADAVLAHAAAVGGPGVVLCAGTGTIVLGLAPDGRSVRVDGWGPGLGDRGSAHALGAAGLRSGIAALDGVGPATALTELLRAYLGGLDLAALQRFHSEPELITRVAGFARQVQSTAAAGDEVSVRLCRRAAGELADSVREALRRLGLTGARRRVVVTGRLAGDGGPVHDLLREALRTDGIGLARPAGTPLEGGLLLVGKGSCYESLVHREEV